MALIVYEQVKPGFTNYQPQPKYSWALNKIEGKGKFGKTKNLWKRSDKLNNSENMEVSENLKILKNSENLKNYENQKNYENLEDNFWKSLRFATQRNEK